MAPLILPFSFGDLPIYEGQSAQVACFVTEGDLPLEIAWSFNGSRDLSFYGISSIRVGHRSKLLIIESVGPKHQGDYTCSVRNPASSTRYSTSLEIHGTHRFAVETLRWKLTLQMTGKRGFQCG